MTTNDQNTQHNDDFSPKTPRYWITEEEAAKHELTLEELALIANLRAGGVHDISNSVVRAMKAARETNPKLAANLAEYNAKSSADDTAVPPATSAPRVEKPVEIVPKIEIERHTLDAIPNKLRVVTICLFGRWHIDLIAWVGFWTGKTTD